MLSLREIFVLQLGGWCSSRKLPYDLQILDTGKIHFFFSFLRFEWLLFLIYLTKYEYEFLEAKITQQTSPEDAYRKLEDMALKQIESLRKLTKDVSILLLKFQLICLFELKWSI